MNINDNLIERTLRALRTASAETDPRRSEMRQLINELEAAMTGPPAETHYLTASEQRIMDKALRASMRIVAESPPLAASHPEDAKRLADIRHNYNMTESRGADVGADVVFMLRLYDAARAEGAKQ